MSNCAISWIPYSGQTLYTHWFLQVTLLQQGINDSSWLGWTFSVWRAERKGKNNTHTSLCCLGTTGTSHTASQNYMTWLLHKQKQPNKKHMKAYAAISPKSPLLSISNCVCTGKVPDCVKLNHGMQQNEARSWKRRMQQKNIWKSPDKSFWTRFSAVKRSQLGSITPGNNELHHAKFLSFAFSSSKCLKTCGKLHTQT